MSTDEQKPKHYLLTRAANKEGEIAFLKKIAAKLEPGTYLSSLFTEQLIEWVSFQITQNDFPPDLFAKYVWIQEENSKHYGELGSARRDLDEARKVVEIMRQELADTARRAELEQAALQGALETTKKQLEKALAETYKWATEARARATDADRLYLRVEELEREVDHQKALRLDLIEKTAAASQPAAS